jgi:hypothetical protein
MDVPERRTANTWPLVRDGIQNLNTIKTTTASPQNYEDLSEDTYYRSGVFPFRPSKADRQTCAHEIPRLIGMAGTELILPSLLAIEFPNPYLLLSTHFLYCHFKSSSLLFTCCSSQKLSAES